MVTELEADVYGLFDTTLELEPEVTVDTVVVPVMTVTVVLDDPDVAVLTDVDCVVAVVPLFSIAPCDCDREELLLVLIGVLKDNRELVLLVRSVLLEVVVDRKTPLVAAKDVVLVLANMVLFGRQDAGMLKQHGKPEDEEVIG